MYLFFKPKKRTILLEFQSLTNIRNFSPFTNIN